MSNNDSHGSSKKTAMKCVLQAMLFVVWGLLFSRASFLLGLPLSDNLSNVWALLALLASICIFLFIVIVLKIPEKIIRNRSTRICFCYVLPIVTAFLMLCWVLVIPEMSLKLITFFFLIFSLVVQTLLFLQAHIEKAGLKSINTLVISVVGGIVVVNFLALFPARALIIDELVVAVFLLAVSFGSSFLLISNKESSDDQAPAESEKASVAFRDILVCGYAFLSAAGIALTSESLSIDEAGGSPWLLLAGGICFLCLPLLTRIINEELIIEPVEMAVAILNILSFSLVSIVHQLNTIYPIAVVLKTCLIVVAVVMVFLMFVFVPKNSSVSESLNPEKPLSAVILSASAGYSLSSILATLPFVSEILLDVYAFLLIVATMATALLFRKLVYRQRKSDSIKNTDKRIISQDKIEALGSQYKLTRREIEIFGLLIEGNNAQEISESLVVSVSTIRSHIKSIYQKTNVHSQTELIRKHMWLPPFI